MVTMLLFISFSAYAVMWTLQFHFTESVFKNLNAKFWNPEKSWQNKWKTSLSKNKILSFTVTDSKGHFKERFPGSSTIFVWLTDAFHLFQFVFLNTLFLAFSFIAEGKELYGFTFHWWSAFIGIRLIYALVFEGWFGWLLIKK
jgi:hypothetical protein